MHAISSVVGADHRRGELARAAEDAELLLVGHPPRLGAQRVELRRPRAACARGARRWTRCSGRSPRRARPTGIRSRAAPGHRRLTTASTGDGTAHRVRGRDSGRSGAGSSWSGSTSVGVEVGAQALRGAQQFGAHRLGEVDAKGTVGIAEIAIAGEVLDGSRPRAGSRRRAGPRRAARGGRSRATGFTSTGATLAVLDHRDSRACRRSRASRSAARAPGARRGPSLSTIAAADAGAPLEREARRAERRARARGRASASVIRGEPERRRDREREERDGGERARDEDAVAVAAVRRRPSSKTWVSPSPEAPRDGAQPPGAAAVGVLGELGGGDEALAVQAGVPPRARGAARSQRGVAQLEAACPPAGRFHRRCCQKYCPGSARTRRSSAWE